MNGKRILVVDDDPAVRDAFELTLSAEGYDVALAPDGLSALAQVRASRPDLVFLDLRMPGLDGVETLRELSRIDGTLRVYVVTAFAQEFMGRLREARAESLHFQLAAKPLSPEQIVLIARAGLSAT